ncbi:restriction endonuclease subunit S [Veillonella sp.]
MANKPRIRFKGFTEDWEQRKLGDFTNQINTFVNPEDAKLPLWSLTAEAGLIEKSDRYERDFLVKKKDQFKRIETNTLVYNPMNITIGSIDIYTGLYPIAVSGYYVSIVYDKNIDTDFLKEALLLPSSLKMYKNYATGSLVERQRVQYPTFSKLQLLFPNLDEQKAIGQLFKSLNLNITLHQCKLEKLKLTKKALLQKLFPKNGKHIPEIRFKGFTDAWEQRKLDDIAKIKTGGGTPKTANPEYWSGNIPWIQSSDLVEGDIVHVNINKFINNNALKNSAAKLISRDSIALVTRVGVGKVAVINQDFTTSQDFLSLSDFDGSDIKFLAYQLYRLMQENAKVLQGTSIKGITKTELIEQSISIPSSGQEQNLISNVLSKIDSIITLHQRKLERLQEVKKGLLQKMFV